MSILEESRDILGNHEAAHELDSPKPLSGSPNQLFGRVLREGGGCKFTESGVILARGKTIIPNSGESNSHLESFLGWSVDPLRDLIQFPPDPLTIEHRYLTDDPYAVRILPNQLRSMSLGVDVSDGSVMRLYSKGNLVALSHELLSGAKEKVFVRKISGGQLQERAVKQYNNASAIQDVAYAVLGRPTHAPIPLQVVEMTNVYVPSVGLVGVGEFFGHGKYMSAEAHRYLRTWVKSKLEYDKTSGKILIEDEFKGKTPDDIINDPNLLGSAYVKLTRPSVLNYLAKADMRVGHVNSDLHQPSSVLRLLKMAETPQNSRKIMDAALAYIYTVNGQKYEPIVDMSDSSGFNPEEYLRAVSVKNMAALEAVIKGFASRHGEAVGLAHGAGYELGGIFVETNTGGATASRNVGVDGSILDLDPVSHERDYVGSISPVTGEDVTTYAAKATDLRFSSATIVSFVRMLGGDDSMLREAGKVMSDTYKVNHILAAGKYRHLSPSEYMDELNQLVRKITD